MVSGDMTAHPLDRAVAWLSRNSRMFSRGWGDESVLAEFSQRTHYLKAPGPIEILWVAQRKRKNHAVRDGKFLSPLPGLPDGVATAHVRAWTGAANPAACVILAASRDEGYAVREGVFGRLVARGIDLYFLENPFYGLRRNGRGPADITVADHGLMALGMVLEARALLESLRPQYARLAVAGYSMGGHMAAITAAVTPMPLG